MTKKIEYVVGFLFDAVEERVVLIRKKRPAWQEGKLNGIGGHIKPGELSLDAMRREFREETGLDVKDWELVAVLISDDFRLHIFSAQGLVYGVSSLTDEQVIVQSLAHLPRNVIRNARWLIPLCLDPSVKRPVSIASELEGE